MTASDRKPSCKLFGEVKEPEPMEINEDGVHPIHMLQYLGGELDDEALDVKGKKSMVDNTRIARRTTSYKTEVTPRTVTKVEQKIRRYQHYKSLSDEVKYQFGWVMLVNHFFS